MRAKWLVGHTFALAGAVALYFVLYASMSEDPARVTEFGLSTGRLLWESRVMDLIVQFVAMLAGTLGVLALTKEVAD